MPLCRDPLPFPLPLLTPGTFHCWSHDSAFGSVNVALAKATEAEGGAKRLELDANECTTGAFCSGSAVGVTDDAAMSDAEAEEEEEDGGAPKPGGDDSGFEISRNPGGGRMVGL